MHSTASDGALSPTELVERAANASIHYLALTDHDTLAGLQEAAVAAAARDIHFIPGIELTCLWGRRSLHLLGLGIDPAYPGWQAYEARLVELREARAAKIATRLVGKRAPADILERARLQAGAGQIGRPHFARALLQAGVVSSENEAFDRYLGQGKVGDVKAEWPSIEEAMGIVQASGGKAILAHPTKYKLTFSRLRLLLADLQQKGIDGFEVAYPGISPDQIGLLMRVANTLDLLVSSGSDFHDPKHHWTGLGRFPRVETPRHIIHRIHAGA
ncbi:PHP domain-containing protein [Marinobacterium weihaiense]|uniref:PHP domain-containing protein n=1 Tax=Marinobacterium weihaiense TaxID=2851016 RepID=A0ABS6MC14_9GAMM|nr:PHP domain-containing protein [Marinobacterium weihaiense]MBV0933424.1 PHP domain-containing protein [Marinobacterium weihaiense]